MSSDPFPRGGGAFESVVFFTIFVAQNGTAHARTDGGFAMLWAKISYLFCVVVANAING